MVQLFFIGLIFCVGAIHAQDAEAAKTETLTNATVIGMVNAKLSPDVILKAIKSSGCAFQLETDNLIALKQAQVPDSIVRAMLSKECLGSHVAKTPRDPALGIVQGFLTWESKVRGHTTSAAEIVLLKGTVDLPADRAAMAVDKNLVESPPPDEACLAELKAITMETFDAKVRSLTLCAKPAIESIQHGTGGPKFEIIKQANADDTGYFEILNITPGEYTLVIRSQDAKGLSLRDMRGKVSVLHLKIQSGKTIDASQNFGTTEF
jgi:hypothetical protein